MEPLWAPWRLDYIEKEKNPGCVFCKMNLQHKKSWRKNKILHKNQHGFVVLNLYPYNPGHLLVVPNFHVSELETLAEEDYLGLCSLVKLSISVLKIAYKPNGFNVGINLGHHAGAGIPEHCHFHIVPRWAGDTNFMPLLSQTKVINEHLYQTYDRLLPLFTSL